VQPEYVHFQPGWEAEAKLNREAASLGGLTFLELALRIRSDIAATNFAAG
jgi:hypothetical protein